MSDFESEEMGWRYWVDAMTTSKPDYREGGETKTSCPRVICVGQCSELFGRPCEDYASCLS